MLTNLSIKPGYSTHKDNISRDFYNTVLCESVSYKRLVCYFSSKALIHFSKGIEGLLKNNGKYQLIISHEISQKDFDLIKLGYENKEKYIKDKLLSLKDLNDFESKKLSNLSYLIEIGLVDVKIGFTFDQGLFHAKYGIMKDSQENSVYFTGSLNETESAFINNYEQIDVKKSWDSLQDGHYIKEIEEEFDDLWEGKNQDNFLYVKSINEILRKELIKYSKGGLILNIEEFTPNALILIYKDNKLQMIDNLSDNINLEDNTSRVLKRIKRDFLVDNQLWEFKSDITYREIEDVLIDRLERFTGKESIKLIISESVYDYIEDSKFQINEFANIGNYLKSDEVEGERKYKEFKKIVQNEVSRPLRDLQLRVSYYMTKMKRSANFSVPGSGKTAMVYGAFSYLNSDIVNEVDKILMVGPKNAFTSWKDEFKNVFGDKKTLNVIDIHSKDFEQRDFYFNSNRANLILVNYESLIKYSKELNSIVNNRTMIVFDEIHRMKNPESKKVDPAIKISEKTKYRYVLTGTPIPNSYQDIYNFLQILFKAEYKSFFNYRLDELKNLTSYQVEELNKRLFPFFWRVTKDKLNVPKAEEDNIIKSVASNQEQEVIDLLWKNYRHQPFKLYIRLIQLSSNPRLLAKNIDSYMFSYDLVDEDSDILDEFFEEEPSLSDREIDLINSLPTSSKFEECIKYAHKLTSESKIIIIWCIFIDTMHLLHERLTQLGLKVLIINGQVDDEVRNRELERFKNGEYDVLITNPHTLGESVSLHKVCHDALYLEYSFNLTHMLQSRDRIHRLGLAPDEKTNYYYFFLSGHDEKRDTIDKKIYNRLKEKEEVMKEAIESDQLRIEFDFDQKEEIQKLMEDN